MYNKYYSYPNMKYWQPQMWEGRSSCITPLAIWIEDRNNTTIRTTAGGGHHAGRTDGHYDAKSKSNIYDSEVSFWKERGLTYHVTEMGGVHWFAMLPNDTVSGLAPDVPVLLVLHSADYSDPNWAMNSLHYYQSYNEQAARDGFALLYVTPDGTDHSNLYIGVLQELAIIYHLSMRQVFLDITTVKKAGISLADIPDFVYQTPDGTKIADPDNGTSTLGNIPVLNITDRWQNKIGLMYETVFGERSQHPTYHLDHHLHSACGRKMSDAVRIEQNYLTAEDPAFQKELEQMGLRYESHDKNGYQWISVTPLNCSEKDCEKLPVMMIFQEVTYISPYQTTIAMAAFPEYLDLAAQDEMILLYFALETPDDNDLFYEILLDAAKQYPVDLSRVYVTGHSHNGHFAGEFARRHHEKLAGVATLGNYIGLPAPEYTRELVPVTNEKIALMSTYDLPLINICAIAENTMTIYEPDTQDFRNSVDSYQRRLRAHSCPEKSYEEIAAAYSSENRITRHLGVPTDRRELQFRYGCECYIGDVKNQEGKEHLRFVVIGNICHICAPQMADLTWDFLRRFKRDLQTGEIVELY